MSSPTPQGTQPTIAEIARELGVSAPTVSKVLNGRTDVAPATRDRVEAALERHSYRRRRAAAPPVGAGLVDLVFHSVGSAWSTEIIRGVEDAAAAAGVSVILSELGGEHRPPATWLETTLSRPPLGVLLVAASLSAAQRPRLTTRGIPYVVIDTDGEPPPDVPTVGSDNWSGGLAATRHLLEVSDSSYSITFSFSSPAGLKKENSFILESAYFLYSISIFFCTFSISAVSG